MSAWVARVVHSHGFESREPSSIPRDPASLIERLSKLAANDPALFLERYGGQLTEDECAQHFAGLEDYEVKWHLARLQRTAAEAAQTRRNRRFRCMLELEHNGDFFTDAAIQARAPALYHEYVGKLLPAGGLAVASGRHCFDEDTPLSERLLANIDEELRSKQVADAAAEAERREELDEDEEDEDEDTALDRQAPPTLPLDTMVAPRIPTPRVSDADDEDDEDEAAEDEAADYTAAALRVLDQERRAFASAYGAMSGVSADPHGPNPPPGDASTSRRDLPDERRVQAGREELLALMKDRFVRGDEAAHFDYAALCDHNLRYDDLEQEARDAEDRYFDED